MTPEGRILAHAKREAKRLGLRLFRLHMGAGVEAGWPDTVILALGGRALWIELKRVGKETMRPLQAHRAEELRATSSRRPPMIKRVIWYTYAVAQVYVVGAFIAFDLDVSHWPALGRATAILAVMLSVIGAKALIEESEDD